MKIACFIPFVVLALLMGPGCTESTHHPETAPVVKQPDKTVKPVEKAAEKPKAAVKVGVVELTDESFASEINFDGYVLVDFGASWCGPCREMAPIIEALAGDFSGKIKVCKLDVDKAPKMAKKYGVSGLPTFMFFKNGKGYSRREGTVSRESLRKYMQSLLK